MTEYDIPKYGDKKNCAIKKSFSMGKMFTEAQKYGLGGFVFERKFDGLGYRTEFPLIIEDYFQYSGLG